MGEVDRRMCRTITVVITIWNRLALLRRSMRAYQDQSFPLNKVEFIMIDDWSTDPVERAVQEWQEQGLNMVYLRPWSKKDGKPRDGATTVNLGYRMASGEFVIYTHPEVIPGMTTMERMMAVLNQHKTPNKIALFGRAYFMSPHFTNLLHRPDMDHLGLSALQAMPEFYEHSLPQPGMVDFSNRTQETRAGYGSQQFWGMTRKALHDTGGLTPYSSWGTVDIDHVLRRRALDIKTIPVPDDGTLEPEAMCAHQFHEGFSFAKEMTEFPPAYTAQSATLDLWAWPYGARH